MRNLFETSQQAVAPVNSFKAKKSIAESSRRVNVEVIRNQEAAVFYCEVTRRLYMQINTTTWRSLVHLLSTASFPSPTFVYFMQLSTTLRRSHLSLITARDVILDAHDGWKWTTLRPKKSTKPLTKLMITSRKETRSGKTHHISSRHLKWVSLEFCMSSEWDAWAEILCQWPLVRTRRSRCEESHRALRGWVTSGEADERWRLRHVISSTPPIPMNVNGGKKNNGWG